MIVLAIDPGYERLGIALIEKSNKKEILLYSDCFKTKSSEVFEKRIVLIGQEINKLIKKWSPDVLAVEKLYLETNQKTAMRVSEARGVLIYEGALANIPIYEFTPLEIKVAITSYGKASKNQVTDMVKRLIAFPNKKTTDDEFDAVALGLTFFAHHPRLSTK